MVKKTGLGKGLDALFSTPVVEEEKQQIGDELKNLKLIEVEPNRSQARKVFDIDSLEELADSIKMYGVIQPIVVTEKKGFYEIVAGERRWRAAKMAGLNEIPAIIKDNNDKRNKEISLIENIQREDLNPIDKAQGIKALIDEYQLTQEEIGKILGMARSSVANTVRILNLSPKVLELAREGKLSEGHCRSLLMEPDPVKQYSMALRIITNDQNCRQVEQTIKRKRKANDFDPRYEAVYRDVEDRFTGYFGTKVKVNAGKRSGKIVIEYKTNSELERILDLIK